MEEKLLEETNEVLKKRSGRLFLGGKEERFSAVSEECCRRELSCVSDLPLRLADS